MCGRGDRSGLAENQSGDESSHSGVFVLTELAAPPLIGKNG